MTLPVEVLVVGTGSDLARIVVAHLAADGVRVHGPVDAASAVAWLAGHDAGALLLDASDPDEAEGLLDVVAGALRDGTPVVALVTRGLDRESAGTLLARGIRHVLAGPITREAVVRAFADEDPTSDALACGRHGDEGTSDQA